MNAPYVRNFSLLFVSALAIVALLMWAGFTFRPKEQPLSKMLQPPPSSSGAQTQSALPSSEIPSIQLSPKEPKETATWKIYRNDSLGFEIKYPPDWFVDTSSSDPTPDWFLIDDSGAPPVLIGDNLAFLKTKKYHVEKASEGCCWRSIRPGEEDKLVKAYDGQITISSALGGFVDLLCEHDSSEEIINIGSYSWRACLLRRDNSLMLPRVFIRLPGSDYYLAFSGGLETETYEPEVDRASEYDFLLLKIIRTFKFTK